MGDKADVVEMIFNGNKNYGVVVKHYTDTLDFYILYSENTLIEWHDRNSYVILVEDIFIPVYDALLTDVKLNRQRIEDYKKISEIIDSLKEMKNIGI